MPSVKCKPCNFDTMQFVKAIPLLIFLAYETHSAQIPVSDEKSLDRAFSSARAGDEIILTVDVYFNTAILSNYDGTKENPITVRSAPGRFHTLICGKFGTLMISNAHWTVENIRLLHPGRNDNWNPIRLRTQFSYATDIIIRNVTFEHSEFSKGDTLALHIVDVGNVLIEFCKFIVYSGTAVEYKYKSEPRGNYVSYRRLSLRNNTFINQGNVTKHSPASGIAVTLEYDQGHIAIKNNTFLVRGDVPWYYFVEVVDVISHVSVSGNRGEKVSAGGFRIHTSSVNKLIGREYRNANYRLNNNHCDLYNERAYCIFVHKLLFPFTDVWDDNSYQNGLGLTNHPNVTQVKHERLIHSNTDAESNGGTVEVIWKSLMHLLQMGLTGILSF